MCKQGAVGQRASYMNMGFLLSCVFYALKVQPVQFEPPHETPNVHFNNVVFTKTPARDLGNVQPPHTDYEPHDKDKNKLWSF